MTLKPGSAPLARHGSLYGCGHDPEARVRAGRRRQHGDAGCTAGLPGQAPRRRGCAWRRCVSSRRRWHARTWEQWACPQGHGHVRTDVFIGADWRKMAGDPQGGKIQKSIAGRRSCVSLQCGPRRAGGRWQQGAAAVFAAGAGPSATRRTAGGGAGPACEAPPAPGATEAPLPAWGAGASQGRP